ncbi:hypothetical protein KAH94_01325 [bacterium]|nr:hypothetical protein [bacterium]
MVGPIGETEVEPGVVQIEKMASPGFLQGLLRQYLAEMIILGEKIQEYLSKYDGANEKTARRREHLKHLGQRCVPHVIFLFKLRHRDVSLDQDLLRNLKAAGADLLV